MPASIIPFLFETDYLVRVAYDANGSLLFVASDVCRILGISKYRDALAKWLTEDERASVFVDTPGGIQEVSAVTESGLYVLIFRSRRPTAIRFRKWVTSDMLPSLRKTGTYTIGPKEGEALNSSLPFQQWSNETVNTRLRIVTVSERLFGVVAGADLWDQLGFPMPAPNLIRPRRQFELWKTVIDTPAQ